MDVCSRAIWMHCSKQPEQTEHLFDKQPGCCLKVEVGLLSSLESVSLLVGDVWREGRRKRITRWEATQGNFIQKRWKREVQTAFSAAEVPMSGKWMEKLSRPSSHGGTALLCMYSMSHWAVVTGLVMGGCRLQELVRVIAAELRRQDFFPVIYQSWKRVGGEKFCLLLLSAFSLNLRSTRF